MLLGRDAELRLLDNLVDGARAGRSHALVLLGDPGVGKTALLNAAGSRADGMQLLRASGVELETDIAFAGLYSLLQPIVRQLSGLPPGQRAALRSALGLSDAADSPAPERLAIAAGTHGLLSLAAEVRPILLLVDDLHWLDAPSAEALLFALRRLDSDAVACVLTTRPGYTDHSGLPTCELSGLQQPEVEQLVKALSGVAPSPAMASRLHVETGGNPLALTQLAATLTPLQLAGSGLSGTELPLNAGTVVLDAYAARLALLPADVRQTVMVAAAAGRAPTAAVMRAAAQVGGAPTLDAAEDAGLIRVDASGIEFTHPLLRTAAYHSSAPSQQRRVHRALAAGLAGIDDERAAWQLAAAASGADVQAAAALDAAAEAAERKGAPLLAADAWERAGELYGPGNARIERYALAGEAALRAGELRRATRLGSLGQDRVLPAGLRARLLAIRGRAEMLTGRMAAAHRTLADAAGLAGPGDRTLAAGLLTQSFDAAFEAGLDDAARQAHDGLAAIATESDATATFQVDRSGGLLAWHNGDPAVAMRLLRRGAERLAGWPALAASPERQLEVADSWALIGQMRRASQHADAAVELAQEEGALGLLASALAEASWYDVQVGRWQLALAKGTQALDLAHASGQQFLTCTVLVTITEIEAAQGREKGCREHAREADALATELELPVKQLLVRRHLASLDMAAGRTDEAVERYEQVYRLALELGEAHPYRSPLMDLIEALARAGRIDRALQLMPTVVAQVPGNENPLPAGRLLRLLGMLADDDFDAHFQQAIDLHRNLMPFQQARSQLCYGERLRRSRRRREARVQLRAAIETFDRLDARPWAERAWTELRASGESMAGRDPAREQLTPQELQIALLVAEGRTNREVGRALFLSTRTVEFHLTRAYRKLGIASRTELTRLLTSAEAAVG